MAFSYVAKVGKIGLHIPWHFLHFLVSIWFLAYGVARVIRSYLISLGLLRWYDNLNMNNLRYLAIVVESEEARKTSRVIKLLQWLAAMGVKHVALYDMEGVLKKSKTTILEKVNAIPWEEACEDESLRDGKHMILEFTSLSDGKEAVAKAANYLFVKNSKSRKLDGDNGQPTFTESNVSEALKAIGCGGPEIDLLLIYGPVRCHLGFSAWRMRYTEIVHMGPLASMKYGSLKKAIHKFTRVHQNYGK
ncbi:uncharacterized protein LOC131156753 [Malania oleifera]|uniref:uncharacterized protein LOC131156753 n=1 Tax=Malania oleifera TaxID=397392 RepID=UPI0025AE5831|nr:uncharacterized protein LOC131156753 [Malania oleifera]